jgi:hypothetical protein
MSYERATWIVSVLRAAGITVKEYDGWRSRGLAGGSFKPRALIWHHDGSSKGDSPGVPSYMIRNFSTAAAQLWVDRAGVWHVIAAGRAPHAGVVKPGKPGNSESLGIETDHTIGEDWPNDQIESLRTGTAAILKHLGITAEAGLEFHRSICFPPGRKTDPDGLDLDLERKAVQQILTPPPPPPPPPASRKIPITPVAVPRVSLSKMRLAAVKDPHAPKGSPTRPLSVKVLQRALVAEGLLDERQIDGVYGKRTRAAWVAWQKSLGFRGADADGLPGRISLRRLGEKRGFVMIP